MGACVSNLTTTAGATNTFFAVWSELRFVSFDGNGADDDGVMAGDDMMFDGVETKALVSNKFAKAGYTFGGWATNETAAAALTATYADGAEVVSTNLWMGVGETNVFFAVWLTNTYSVVFDANGGSGEMERQRFVYDQAQSLAKNRFASSLVFMGWATNATGAVVFGDEDEVPTLTAEPEGEVALYAVWDNGDLSWAMHCDNLAWEQEDGIDETTGEPLPGTDWCVVSGVGEGYASSGSSISNLVIWTMDKDKVRSKILKPSSASGSGKLSFWFKASTDSSENWLNVKLSDDQSQSLNASTEWTRFGPFDVPDIAKVNIYQDFDLNSGDDCTIWIDQMTWVPDSPGPTEEDRPVISAFAPATADAGSGFRIQIANASSDFDYQILATNDLTTTEAWPVIKKLSGAEMNEGCTIEFDEDEPQMFYKVKVVEKQ